MGRNGSTLTVTCVSGPYSRRSRLFDFGSYQVRGVYRHVGAEPDAHFDGYAGPQIPCTQSVGVLNAGYGRYHLQDTVFFGSRKPFFEQVAEIGDDEFDADFNDEGAYHNGRHRVHDDPFASEGSGGAYAEQGGYRGECVAAVMPGVGDNGPALYPSSRSEGVPVEPLLRCDGDGSGNDGYQARPLECGAGEYRA